MEQELYMNTSKYICGDKVLNEGEIFTVIEVMTMYKYKVYVILDDNNERYYIIEHRLDGIPLTSEILEKNGWIKNPFGEGGYIERYTQNGLTLFIYHAEDDEWICRIGDYDVKIKFVHQLQHLLFGLGLNSSIKV